MPIFKHLHSHLKMHDDEIGIKLDGRHREAKKLDLKFQVLMRIFNGFLSWKFLHLALLNLSH